MKKKILFLVLITSLATGCSDSKSGSANDTTMNYKVKIKIRAARDTIKKDTMKNDSLFSIK